MRQSLIISNDNEHAPRWEYIDRLKIHHPFDSFSKQLNKQQVNKGNPNQFDGIQENALTNKSQRESDFFSQLFNSFSKRVRRVYFYEAIESL